MKFPYISWHIVKIKILMFVEYWYCSGEYHKKKKRSRNKSAFILRVGFEQNAVNEV